MKKTTVSKGEHGIFSRKISISASTALSKIVETAWVDLYEGNPGVYDATFNAVLDGGTKLTFHRSNVSEGDAETILEAWVSDMNSICFEPMWETLLQGVTPDTLARVACDVREMLLEGAGDQHAWNVWYYSMVAVARTTPCWTGEDKMQFTEALSEYMIKGCAK